ncbi:hypothetical protein EDB92DRAFT_475538 [Lactarius akahatsu]|uniref:Uncharacterized protein n=1 Tax=Lactarius akahatsu TaxID=416441 RepID=A0AAD4LRZ5_9AGAM|nr:hypothetical protein EDB92DRAFT_475538 [Lactarius akahatsu]
MEPSLPVEMTFTMLAFLGFPLSTCQGHDGTPCVTHEAPCKHISLAQGGRLLTPIALVPSLSPSLLPSKLRVRTLLPPLPPLHVKPLSYFSTQLHFDSSYTKDSFGVIPTMTFRPRRTTMRPVREFDCVLRARDQQVSTLHEQSIALKAQLETTERRLTNARANAHADARAFQLQERKFEQLRMKLRDIRGGSAAQRRELEDVKRESEVLKTLLAEAREETVKHLARIAELENGSQEVSQPTPTSNLQSLDLDGVSHDDILDALVQATIGLEALTEVSEDTSPGDSPSWPTTPVDWAETGIQTFFDDNTGANHRRICPQELRDAKDTEHLVSRLRAASEQDQRRIRDLEVNIERGHRLTEELRIAREEERRLVRSFEASSVQAQSRVVSLEDAARQDRRTIEALEATVETCRSEIDCLEAQSVLLHALLDESRTFNDDLEENYGFIIQCKDALIQDLREKIEDLAASGAWDRHREAAFSDIQEKLEASEVEILELRAELEGAQQNAVVSTNRIIHLEAEASAARHRLRTTDAENGDLRDELGMTIDRGYALEEELHEAQDRLDNAESTIRQLRQELYQYTDALTKSPPDVQDVIDADSASDVGSIDTLVMDYDEHWQLQSSGNKDVDSRASFDHGQQFIHNFAPVSMRALELRLEAMTLKYKAAEAARICGEDVEDRLRTELQTLSGGDSCQMAQISAAPVPTADLDANSPVEELHGLSPIPEEEETDTSPLLQRVALPRIQTCPPSATATMNVVVQAVARGGSVRGSAFAFSNSPLLPSPTLSDIWFSDVIASLALTEGTGRSVLEWELPSPGSDSDSS